MQAITSDRPTYTKDQVGRYFDRIKLPESKRKFDVKNETPAAGLDYLALLQRYTLASIPFENLSLHYSHHKRLTLDPEELFRKMVERPGRGGYCMENNCIFSVVLRTLGFELYATGARVFMGKWSGWDHMVNLVTIDGVKYLVDVGYGANCIVRPIPLLKDGKVYENAKPASVRLVWRNIEAHRDPNQRLWVYEHRIDEQHDFTPCYSFTETEFLPQDFEIMNYYTSTSPYLFFTRQIVCAKMLLDEAGDNVIGAVILQNYVKRRLHGENKSEPKFANEEERIKALEVEFGISFTATERNAIKGMVSEIKPEIDFS